MKNGVIDKCFLSVVDWCAGCLTSNRVRRSDTTAGAHRRPQEHILYNCYNTVKPRVRFSTPCLIGRPGGESRTLVAPFQDTARLGCGSSTYLNIWQRLLQFSDSLIGYLGIAEVQSLEFRQTGKMSQSGVGRLSATDVQFFEIREAD